MRRPWSDSTDAQSDRAFAVLIFTQKHFAEARLIWNSQVCLLISFTHLTGALFGIIESLCIWASARQEPTIRLVRPAKTQISLRMRAVWSDSSLIACVYYSLRLSKEGQTSSCHTGWMYRLIWAFAGHTGFIVGFVMRWLNDTVDSLYLKHW